MKIFHKKFENVAPASFNCDHAKCGKTFDTSKKLYDHKLQIHSKKAFKCPQCPLAFTLPSKLKRHSAVHEKRVCNVDGCSVELRSHREKRRHVARCHQKVNCDLCSTIFASRREYKRHEREIHKKLTRCPQKNCEKLLLPRRTASHIKEAHAYDLPKIDEKIEFDGPNKPYSCPQCKSAFEKPENLKHHVTRCHLTKNESDDGKQNNERRQKRFHCPVPACGLAFLNRIKLDSHVNAHNNVKPYRCPQCSRQYCGKLGLQKHLRLRHLTTLDEYSIEQVLKE